MKMKKDTTRDWKKRDGMMTSKQEKYFLKIHDFIAKQKMGRVTDLWTFDYGFRGRYIYNSEAFKYCRAAYIRKYNGDATKDYVLLEVNFDMCLNNMLDMIETAIDESFVLIAAPSLRKYISKLRKKINRQ